MVSLSDVCPCELKDMRYSQSRHMRHRPANLVCLSSAEVWFGGDFLERVLGSEEAEELAEYFSTHGTDRTSVSQESSDNVSEVCKPKSSL